MNCDDLEKAREAIFPGHGGISKMALALNTPRGTYLKWERGERRVPGIVEVALESLNRRNIVVDHPEINV